MQKYCKNLNLHNPTLTSYPKYAFVFVHICLQTEITLHPSYEASYMESIKPLCHNQVCQSSRLPKFSFVLEPMHMMTSVKIFFGWKRSTIQLALMVTVESNQP